MGAAGPGRCDSVGGAAGFLVSAHALVAGLPPSRGRAGGN